VRPMVCQLRFASARASTGRSSEIRRYRREFCLDFGDVVEKFTAPPPGGGGNLPQASPIVGVGPPSASAFEAGPT
jgi:hypothetical protein